MAVQLKKSAEGRFTSDKYKIDRVAVSSDGQLKTEKDLSKHAEVSVFIEPASEKRSKPSLLSKSIRIEATSQCEKEKRKRRGKSENSLQAYGK